MIQIPLDQNEMCVKYTVNNGQPLEFFVPGRNENMRWAAYSVNKESCYFEILVSELLSVQRI